MTRRSYSGNAPQTSLAEQVSAGGTQLTLTDATGYPTGVSGPFFLALDIGKSTEEKVLCSSRNSDIVTVASRGADGTTASSHAQGATVTHVWTAVDADESNAHVNATGDVHGVAGNLQGAIESAAGAAGADAVADHEAKADPHAQYLTQAEGDALFLTAAEGDSLFTTPAENDARYLKLTGGALTGDLSTTADVGLAAAAPLTAGSAVPKRYVDAVTVGVPSGFRNVIRNGDMQISQRGSGPFTLSGYNLDGVMQYSYNQAGISVTRANRTAGKGPFLRAVVSAQSAADHYAYVLFPVEDVNTLQGQVATLSFVASVSAGTMNVGVMIDHQYGSGGTAGPDQFVPSGSPIVVTTTSTRYSLTFTMPSTAGKTLGTGDSVRLVLWLSAGSALTQMPGVGLQNNTIDLVDVQLEAGSVATAFEKLPVQQQLAWCQRYFYRHGGVASDTHWGSAMGYSGGAVQMIVRLPVPMRVPPTVAPVGLPIIWKAPGVYLNINSIAPWESTTSQIVCDALTNSGIVPQSMYEIRQLGANLSYADCSAEL